MRITIDDVPPVTCRCECGRVGQVADLEAAVNWAFHEAQLHGPGCHLDILVDMKLHVQYLHERGQPTQPS